MATKLTIAKIIISLITVTLMITNIFMGGGVEIPTFIFTAITLALTIGDKESKNFLKWIWGFNTIIWFILVVMAYIM